MLLKSKRTQANKFSLHWRARCSAGVLKGLLSSIYHKIVTRGPKAFWPFVAFRKTSLLFFLNCECIKWQKIKDNKPWRDSCGEIKKEGFCMGIECYKWHKTRKVVMYMSDCTMRQTWGDGTGRRACGPQDKNVRTRVYHCKASWESQEMPQQRERNHSQEETVGISCTNSEWFQPLVQRTNSLQLSLSWLHVPVSVCNNNMCHTKTGWKYSYSVITHFDPFL